MSKENDWTFPPYQSFFTSEANPTEVESTETSFSSKPPLKVEKIRPDAILPERQNEGDAGLDLALPKDVGEIPIEPNRQKLIGFGFKVAVPGGHEGQLRPRSSLALDKTLTVPNTPGTVDARYRGEMKVILYNYGETRSVVEGGDRVAQLVINEIRLSPVVETNVDRNGRGGGFGSTGK